MPKQPHYIRVATDYFKIIEYPDSRYPSLRYREPIRWKKDEIKTDHPDWRDVLRDMPKYDKFILMPDNIDYKPSIDNCFNLYYPFPHTPKEGDWPWTETLLRHVFAEQYEAGLIYLKCLYMHPKQILPILVLISKERGTGKTTFFNWLQYLFAQNMVQIEPDELSSIYNGGYATANIIAVDETLVDKQMTTEKIKSLATKKNINVNYKYVNPFQAPFFGKVIFASNNETRFMRIDREEIRFWVRKLQMPINENHNIEDDLVSEIPAFLHYLRHIMPDVDRTRSRMVLTPEQIGNEYLDSVKDESSSGLFKEITILLDEYWQDEANKHYNEIRATLSDMKEQWFYNDHNISRGYLKRVLKDEFQMEPEKSQRYDPFNKGDSKTGTPYVFRRTSEINEDEIEPDETEPPF